MVMQKAFNFLNTVQVCAGPLVFHPSKGIAMTLPRLKAVFIPQKIVKGKLIDSAKGVAFDCARQLLFTFCAEDIRNFNFNSEELDILRPMKDLPCRVEIDKHDFNNFFKKHKCKASKITDRQIQAIKWKYIRKDELVCPVEYVSFIEVFQPSGYDKNICAGCGLHKRKHLKQTPLVNEIRRGVTLIN
jgi:hypothetical protein